ncbi:MAG: methionyl-tRNA formyltransferase, partial [Chthoniobacterales bacterium]
IGVPVLRFLCGSKEHELAAVVTQPDKPVGRDQRIQPPPVKAALANTSIPVLQPARIKRDEAVAMIRTHHPDVVVVMAYGQILPRVILEIPRLACLNLHASLLPRHRGAAPVQAAIVAGDTESGITVMYMDEGLDTGDILLQARLPLRHDETGGSLHDRLSEIAPAALAEAMRQLQAGTAPRLPQDSAAATYAPKLEREHGLIDWSEAPEAIERKVRAFNPWPGAYTILKDKAGHARKVKIFSAAIAHGQPLAPGEVITSPADGLMIGARGGALLLQEVQLEGKKRMSAPEFVRGQLWIAQATVSSSP